MVLIFNMRKAQEVNSTLDVGTQATTTELTPKTGPFKDRTEHPTTANHFKGPPPIQLRTTMCFERSFECEAYTRLRLLWIPSQCYLLMFHLSQKLEFLTLLHDLWTGQLASVIVYLLHQRCCACL